MSEIKVNGNIEEALKKFKRQCARNGVLQEVRKRNKTTFINVVFLHKKLE